MQESSVGSRLTKERLKNQGKIHAKIGASVGAEETPVHCNTGAKWARVRCNTLVRHRGCVGPGKEDSIIFLQKRLNEIAS